jgi:hypothetical protein
LLLSDDPTADVTQFPKVFDQTYRKPASVAVPDTNRLQFCRLKMNMLHSTPCPVSFGWAPP